MFNCSQLCSKVVQFKNLHRPLFAVSDYQRCHNLDRMSLQIYLQDFLVELY